ncbi:hypothetical protein C8R45DRAFT_975367 [Mycena sanguinolenta]|nr:hypothetical protein C8R45DRAFT_975367 [Mycena sanguinolenta]
MLAIFLSGGPLALATNSLTLLSGTIHAVRLVAVASIISRITPTIPERVDNLQRQRRSMSSNRDQSRTSRTSGSHGLAYFLDLCLPGPTEGLYDFRCIISSRKAVRPCRYLSSRAAIRTRTRPRIQQGRAR